MDIKRLKDLLGLRIENGLQSMRKNIILLSDNEQCQTELNSIISWQQKDAPEFFS